MDTQPCQGPTPVFAGPWAVRLPFGHVFTCWPFIILFLSLHSILNLNLRFFRELNTQILYLYNFQHSLPSSLPPYTALSVFLLLCLKFMTSSFYIIIFSYTKTKQPLNPFGVVRMHICFGLNTYVLKASPSFFPLINLLILHPDLSPGPLPIPSSPSPLRRGGLPTGYQPTLACQVIAGLGTSFPTEPDKASLYHLVF